MRHILRHPILCRSQLAKARGLMFSPKRTLVFEFRKDTHVPLHMLFVFFPIDVLYLNKNKKVIEVKSNFKPFTFYTPNVKARYVVELPYRANASVGDSVTFK
ncbi:DUF192 domain-containing protein [Candidatus Woesearchaeota archaeon]|nr:DUF192 domain-containing protein [Candidatus Woesearchaeota archaeon]